jgi:hypothetical protein
MACANNVGPTVTPYPTLTRTPTVTPKPDGPSGIPSTGSHGKGGLSSEGKAGIISACVVVVGFLP